MKTASLDIIIAGTPSEVGETNRDSYVSCDGLDGALRTFKENVAAAERQAVTAMEEAAAVWDGLLTSVNSFLETSDTILSGNPDPEGIKNSDELADALNLTKQENTDADSIAQQMASRFGGTVAQGQLFPSGDTDLTSLKEMLAYEDSIGEVIESVSASNGSFVLYTTHIVTTETTASDGCADYTQLSAEEVLIGKNLSIGASAKEAGIDEDSVLIKVFWIGEVNRTTTNIQRLKALGLPTDAVQAAVLVQSTDRTTVRIIDLGTVDTLLDTDADPDKLEDILNNSIGKVNLQPDPDQIVSFISGVVTAGGGSASDGTAGNIPGAALIARTVDVSDTFGLDQTLNEIDVTSFDDQDPNEDEEDFFGRTDDAYPDTVAGEDPDKERANACRLLALALEAGAKGLQNTMRAFQKNIANPFTNVNSGIGIAQKTLEYSSCVGRFSLGSPLSAEKTQDLGLQLIDIRDKLSLTLEANQLVAEAIDKVRCLPRNLSEVLRGGDCTLDALDVGLCPEVLEGLMTLVDNMTFSAGLIVDATLGVVGTLQFAVGQMEAKINQQAIKLTPCQQEIIDLASPLYKVLKNLG